uniref:DUF4408 domain-containing protein n=1 Tax=Oryza punctata TaxID=4537 RepID=A0A0E0MPM8_ORYPU
MLPLLNMQAVADGDAEKSGKQQQQKMIAKVSISILVMSLPVLYVSFLRIPPATLFRDTTFWFLMSNSIIIVIAADSGMLFFAGRPSDVVDRPLFVSSSGELLAPPPMNMAIKNDQAMVVSELGDVSHALVVARGGQEGDGVVAVKPEEESTMMLVPYYGAGGAVVQAARPTRLTASKSVAGSREAERMARRRRRSRSHSHYALVAPPVQEKSIVVREEKLRRTATERPPEPEEEEEMTTTSEYSQLSDEELNRRVEEFIARFNMEIRLQLEKEQEQAAAA